MRLFVGTYEKAARPEDIEALQEAGEKLAKAANGVFVLVPHGCNIEEFTTDDRRAPYARA